MRAINTFKYKNRTFKAGELTVGGYYLSTKDFEAFVEQILTEFNKERPKLTQEYLNAFLKILFRQQDDALSFVKPRPSNDSSKDFHIVLGLFMKVMQQGYNDIKDMPYELFEKMYEDIEILSGQKEYDKDRHKETPDKAGLKKAFGENSIIKG